MILPKNRDKRFITIRRGGMLTDGDHRLLALWAAECAERPRRAIEAARLWGRGDLNMLGRAMPPGRLRTRRGR